VLHAVPAMPLAPLFPILLALLAIGWIVRHVRAWRVVRAEERDPVERDFEWRRFRRRMQASAILVLVAAAMFVGLLISYREHPSQFVYVWCGVVALVAWLVILALADAVSSRLHVSRLHRDHRIERARLEAEVARLRRERDDATRIEHNGHPPAGNH
jgi:uncharacterized membrane protein (DUF4010 family)